MTQRQVFLPLPRLHVFEDLQHPHRSLLSSQCDAEQPEVAVASVEDGGVTYAARVIRIVRP